MAINGNSQCRNIFLSATLEEICCAQHIHPSGVAEPSQADHLITERIRKALELIDVRVLDHFIVGHDGCASLARLGAL